MLANDLTVANAILDKAAIQEISVTPMQLQKLLYFANGWHMEIHYGEPIVSNSFEAWQFGPVLPEIYNEFKRFGSRKITDRAKNPFNDKVWAVDLKPEQSVLMAEIVQMYGTLSKSTISHLIHKEGTPWSLTWRNGLGHGDDITQNLIAAEFEKIRLNAVTAA